MARSLQGKIQIGIKVDIQRARKGAKGFIKLLREVTEEACQATARKVAQVGAQEAQDILEEQRKAETWPPLNKDYLDRKIHEGYDPRMLIRSRFYLENIKWWKVRGSGKGRKAEYRFGVKQVQHPDAKMKLGRLAAIHEYGNRRTPARPFWRPLAYNLRRRKGFLRTTFRGIFERLWKTRAAKLVQARAQARRR
jgi:hypothetical protein